MPAKPHQSWHSHPPLPLVILLQLRLSTRKLARAFMFLQAPSSVSCAMSQPLMLADLRVPFLVERGMLTDPQPLHLDTVAQTLGELGHLARQITRLVEVLMPLISSQNAAQRDGRLEQAFATSRTRNQSAVHDGCQSREIMIPGSPTIGSRTPGSPSSNTAAAALTMDEPGQLADAQAVTQASLTPVSSRGASLTPTDKQSVAGSERMPSFQRQAQKPLANRPATAFGAGDFAHLDALAKRQRSYKRNQQPQAHTRRASEAATAAMSASNTTLDSVYAPYRAKGKNGRNGKEPSSASRAQPGGSRNNNKLLRMPSFARGAVPSRSQAKSETGSQVAESTTSPSERAPATPSGLWRLISRSIQRTV